MIDWGWLWGGAVFFIGAVLILTTISLVTELFKWVGRKWL